MTLAQCSEFVTLRTKVVIDVKTFVADCRNNRRIIMTDIQNNKIFKINTG